MLRRAFEGSSAVQALVIGGGLGIGAFVVAGIACMVLELRWWWVLIIGVLLWLAMSLAVFLVIANGMSEE